MDQIKIGEYISLKRKKKNLTQEELAEKLGITDRAISKWENGVCMPDVSNIPLLCDILEISINDLFSGCDVNMKEFEKKVDENLLSLKRMEEENNRRMFHAINILGIFSTLFYFAFVFLLVCTVPENSIFVILMLSVSFLWFIAMFICLKFESSTGYHECKNCHHKFKPTFKQVFFAAHIGYNRKLRCPECGRKTWCKKVLSK